MNTGNPGIVRCPRLWLESALEWSARCSAPVDRANPGVANWDPVAAAHRRARSGERTHRGEMDWSAPSSTPARPRVAGDPLVWAEVADSRPDHSTRGRRTNALDRQTS